MPISVFFFWDCTRSHWSETRGCWTRCGHCVQSEQ